MNLPGSQNQKRLDRLFRADGTASSTVKLVLPRSAARSCLILQNTGVTNPLWFDIGSARATATITNGVVTSLTVLNGGFGFLKPPIVTLLGGGSNNGQFAAALSASGWDGRGQLDQFPVPSGIIKTTTPNTVYRPANVTAVLTSGVVTSFVINDGGAGYVNAPEVLIANQFNDPFGCADASNSSGQGFYLVAGATLRFDATFCPTEQISVYSASGTTYAVGYAV